MSTTIRKSFKREIACAGLAFWGLLTAFMFWYAPVARLEALHTPYEAVTWSAWAYAAAAFGMHSLATQFGKKG